ncbi:MAG: class I SAM-dependent methyltransferase [Candidatus Zixiibacteriota bacterium]
MPRNRIDKVKEMNEYYGKRASLHDAFMGYTDNETMERLLAPIIGHIEQFIEGKDVLEIACGTGNWTQVLAKRARSVLAIDVNATVLEIARTKSYVNDRVTFRIADAYALEKVEGSFNAAFAGDWWSHIPKSRIPQFLKTLHSKLSPGSPVVFVDMMRREELDRMFAYYDEEGNIIHERSLPDGRVFHVVKNHPTEDELRRYLKDTASNIQYHEDHGLLRWVLSYTVD